CGAAVTGRFCASCGTPRVGTLCAGCNAPLAPAARFCSSCGRQVGGGAAASPSGERTPWIIAGVALAGLLGVLLLMISRGSPTPSAAAEAAGAFSDNGGSSAAGAQGPPPPHNNNSPPERVDPPFHPGTRAPPAPGRAPRTP